MADATGRADLVPRWHAPRLDGIFDGEGDYAGLTAMAEVAEAGSGFTLRGVVIEGEIPPAPESMSVK